MTTLDRRLNAFRDDLADARLKERVEAARFVQGKPAEIVVAVTDFLCEQRVDSGLATQGLMGEAVTVFEDRDGWSWVQRDDDGYVGYVETRHLAPPTGETTHRIVAPRTFLYPKADLKTRPLAGLSMGSRVRVSDHATTRGTDYHVLADGSAIIARHLAHVDECTSDPVDVAESLIATPYLWGGDSAFGIDCSGLMRLAHMMSGRVVLRDSDMQAASIGTELKTAGDYSNLQRGDLVFWKGHVGIMQDAANLIHANGHTMDVAVEPLAQAIDRIGYLYGPPTLVRRPGT